MPLTAGAVGLLLAKRVPSNAVGWLFLGVGLISALNFFLDGYVGYAIFTRRESLPGTLAAAWALDWMWIPLVGSSAVFLPLLFPDGHLLSRRWRGVAYAGTSGVVAGVIGIGLSPRQLEFAGLPNPAGVLVFGAGLEWLGIVGVMSVVVSALAAVASQFVRYRRAGEDQQHQIKWVAVAAALAGVAFALVALDEARPGPATSQPLATAMVLSITLLPIATAVAVLRYRLYDIDALINRTFVYVPLTALLAGLYIAMIGVLRSAFQAVSAAGSEAAVALSTIMIVALLTPAKNQLQVMVDRRFKEAPNPAAELKRITEQMQAFADVADIEALLARYLDAVVKAFRPEGASIRITRPMSIDFQVGTSGTVVEPLLTVPLEHAGRIYGDLTIGGRGDRRPYGSLEVQTLRASAGAAARVLSIIVARAG